MSHESAVFRVVAARNIVRVRVAGIVIAGHRLLVQRPTDDPSACFAFIGGEYEIGDTFEARLRREFEEETTARVIRAEYRFVVENRFVVEGQTIHSLEHYFEVEIDGEDIRSAEPHLSHHWLSLAEIHEYDLRPRAVRDLIGSGEFRRVRHLVAEPLIGPA